MNQTSLTKGTIYVTISSLIFMVSGYLTNIWLGRYLGPSDYGVYGIIISLLTTVNLIQTSGIPQAISKFVAEDDTKSASVFTTGLKIQVVSTLLLSLSLFFCSDFIASLLNDKDLAPYIRISALVLPTYGIYAVYLAYYNGKHYFKNQAVMNSVYALSKLITVLVFIYFFHLYGVIIGFIISPLIGMVKNFFIPQIRGDFPIKKLILFSLPLIGIAISSMTLQTIDLFFVKSVLTSNILTGIYTANQNIARIPFYALSALASVLYPIISRYVSQNRTDQTKRIISNTMRFIFIIVLPGILLLSATSGPLLELFYSRLYISGAESLSILVIGIGFFTIFNIQSNILSGAGKPNIPLVISLISLGITCVLCWILIPVYKLNGAAISTTVGSLLAAIIASFIIFRHFQVLISLKSFIRISLTAVLIYSIVRVIPTTPFALPLIYLSSYLIFFIILYLIKEISREDMKFIHSRLPLWLSKWIPLDQI